MSTSLLKMIGLYLSPEDAARLCVPDVHERLEELDGERSLDDGLMDFVQNVAQSDPDLTAIERTILVSDARSLVEELQAGRVQGYELLAAVRCYDTHHGFLLGSLDCARELRRNNRIDWLENSENPEDWQLKIQPLMRPIHSWGGYRCKGPVSPELASLLDEGIRLQSGLRPSMLRMLEDDTLAPQARRVRALATFDAHFRPEVDPLCAVLAMSIGMFKPEVTRLQIEEALVPSIITTWL